MIKYTSKISNNYINKLKNDINQTKHITECAMIYNSCLDICIRNCATISDIIYISKIFLIKTADLISEKGYWTSDVYKKTKIQ